eukprot:SAG31_NODE_36329_length_314_cov_0.953488_2_plen_31_part_01
MVRVTAGTYGFGNMLHKINYFFGSGLPIEPA